VEYCCVLTKVDWLAACISLRVVGAVLVVSSGTGVMPKEICQTLLTNKTQGNLN
jgi:hypothetical protein